MCYCYSNFISYGDTGELVLRYKLRVSERNNLKKRNADWDKFKERFDFYYANGFDHQQLPVITMERPDEIQFLYWGLIPHWVKNWEEAKERRKNTLNAKCETVFDLPSFRYSIKTKRCLVPATGFFEWRDINGKKYPYHVMVRDNDFPDTSRDFCFGGIYSTWVNKEDGEVINSFCIITTPANSLMAKIHNTKLRMPLILHREDETVWLTEGLDESHIKTLIQPYPAELMGAYSIGKRITARGINRNDYLTLQAEEYPGVEDFMIGGDRMNEGLFRLKDK